MDRPIIMAVVMALVIAGVGYASINASKYNEVSSLAGVEAPTRVTVKGDVVIMDVGSMVMLYKGKVYDVDSRGPYAIAEARDGSDSLVLFLLKGENGFMVAAVYPAKEFITKYGGSPIIDPSIVVDGVYMPSDTLVITMDGEQIEVPVLEIITILKGCHSSYQQEQATVS